MKLIINFCFLVFLTSCMDMNTITDKSNTNENQIMSNTTIPKVTGIGGIFFKTDNPIELKEWYGNSMGLAVSEYGSSFEFRNANRPDEINYLQWSPFHEGTKHFDPSNREFMINYRVQNIEALVQKLKENGATVVDSIQSYSYGKFVHVMDPFGNNMELWEPIDSELTKLGGPTTK